MDEVSQLAECMLATLLENGGAFVVSAESLRATMQMRREGKGWWLRISPQEDGSQLLWLDLDEQTDATSI